MTWPKTQIPVCVAEVLMKGSPFSVVSNCTAIGLASQSAVFMPCFWAILEVEIFCVPLPLGRASSSKASVLSLAAGSSSAVLTRSMLVRTSIFKRFSSSSSRMRSFSLRNGLMSTNLSLALLISASKK